MSAEKSCYGTLSAEAPSSRLAFPMAASVGKRCASHCSRFHCIHNATRLHLPKLSESRLELYICKEASHRAADRPLRAYNLEVIAACAPSSLLDNGRERSMQNRRIPVMSSTMGKHAVHFSHIASQNHREPPAPSGGSCPVQSFGHVSHARATLSNGPRAKTPTHLVFAGMREGLWAGWPPQQLCGKELPKILPPSVCSFSSAQLKEGVSLG